MISLLLVLGIRLRGIGWRLAGQNRLGGSQTERGYIATGVTTDTLSRKSHADNRLGYWIETLSPSEPTTAYCS